MENWLIISVLALLGVMLVFGFVVIYNTGFNSCQNKLNQTIKDIGDKENLIREWRTELEAREGSLNQTLCELENCTENLKECRKLVDIPYEYSLVFFTLNFTPEEIRWIIFASIYSAALCIILPIALSLFKVKIKFSKNVEFCVMISFIALIILILVLGLE